MSDIKWDEFYLETMKNETQFEPKFTTTNGKCTKNNNDDDVGGILKKWIQNNNQWCRTKIWRWHGLKITIHLNEFWKKTIFGAGTLRQENTHTLCIHDFDVIGENKNNFKMKMIGSDRWSKCKKCGNVLSKCFEDVIFVSIVKIDQMKEIKKQRTKWMPLLIK